MKNLTLRYYGKMKLFFQLTYGLYALIIVLAFATGDSKDTYGSLIGIAGFISIPCIWIFYYYLIKLCGIFDKSRITWVGGSVITSPFGAIVAYVNMSNLVKKTYAT